MRKSKSVLGHELTHIRNGDVRMLVIAVIIAGVISFFAELVFRLLFQGGFAGTPERSGSDRKGAGIAILIAVALIAVAWMLSIVIRFALSRKREYLADAGSVELTKNPDAMISALRKIEGRGELAGATSAVMEMCIDNPREGFSNIFDTHPTVDARVAALVQFAGGHDPGPLALPEPSAVRSDDEPVDQLAPAGPSRKRRRRPAAPSRSCRVSRRSSSVHPRVASPDLGDRTAGSTVCPPVRDRKSMPLERNQRAHRHVELAQLVGPAEVGQIDDEAGGEYLCTQLAQQLDRPFRRSAGGDQVVHQDHAVALVSASSCISISSRPYSSE